MKPHQSRVPRILSLSIWLVLLLAGPGCKKYLDARSDQSLQTIQSLQDMQALLEQFFIINRSTPCADETSSDEYYLTGTTFQSLPAIQLRNQYTWQPGQVFVPYTFQSNDWALTYNNVYLSNIVLGNIGQVPRNNSNAVQWDNVKGQALFLRAYSLYKAASIWSLAWDSATAARDLGIPLKLSPDFNAPSERATVQATYAQVLADARQAAALLPDQPLHVYRASRQAALALLSRICMAMRQYPLAGRYADSSLQINSTLLDFNNLKASATFPIRQFNAEVLYESSMGGSSLPLLRKTSARIDSSLYGRYDPNDLRRAVFFFNNADGSKGFKGSYEGNSVPFNGLAVDEMYLNRAEAFARVGNAAAAFNDLNTLLVRRYRTGTFIPLTAANTPDLLQAVLTERQKELLMRGIRWTDLKRLNKEGAGISLVRLVNGTTFTLPPNDPRYALAIPEDIIALSGITQNPR
jgi:starch-binding outer membrane protein, SusD/RagB family